MKMCLLYTLPLGICLWRLVMVEPEGLMEVVQGAEWHFWAIILTLLTLLGEGADSGNTGSSQWNCYYSQATLKLSPASQCLSGMVITYYLCVILERGRRRGTNGGCFKAILRPFNNNYSNFYEYHKLCAAIIVSFFRQRCSYKSYSLTIFGNSSKKQLSQYGVLMLSSKCHWRHLPFCVLVTA